MGNECVRVSPRQGTFRRSQNLKSYQKEVIGCSELLHLQINITNLRVTNMTKMVSSIKFQICNLFEVQFCQDQASISQKVIKWDKGYKGRLIVEGGEIQTKKMKIFLYDNKNDLYQLCTGPYHQDHLLKELKSRLAFDIKITQQLKLNININNLRLEIIEQNQRNLEDYGYSIILTGLQDEQIYESQVLFCDYGTPFKQNTLSFYILSHHLKQSIIKIQIWKKNPIEKFTDIFIPYRKIMGQCFTTYILQSKEYQARKLTIEEQLRVQGKIIGKAYFTLSVTSSKLHVEQMECLIFSQNGIGTISPAAINSTEEGRTQISELKVQLSQLNKIGDTYDKKRIKQLKKILGQIYELTKPNSKICYKSQSQLSSLQILLIQILEKVSKMMQQAEDVMNQNLWRIINTIIHRPQISIRYLNTPKNTNQKQYVALQYYSFICTLLQKIIQSTTMGFTFHQLKCIQKFIAYAYFRFPWLQKVVIHSITKKSDPLITNDKLVEIGACKTSKTTSKSIVYDWETTFFRLCSNNPTFKKRFSILQDLSLQIPNWANVLFNRQDDELFYGLLIQIWNEAEVSLTYQGTIRWQYFPFYGQLLGSFLGQMTDNKLIDYSSIFKQCSLKLILNQRLLNSFMMLLFPKTCLFESYCVLKCLDFVQSYFQIVNGKKKLLPKDFNFNYFFAGIKSVLQSNHSHLLLKIIRLIYNYYHLFSMQFKIALNNYILSKIFWQLFLHWCGFVRSLFCYLLYFKIKPSFQDQSDIKQKDYAIRFQLKQKFSILFLKLENMQKENSDYNYPKYNRSKEYYQHMKEQLSRKKCRKKQQLIKIDQNKISQINNQMKRKCSLNDIEHIQRFQKRKWSMQQSMLMFLVPQQLKTYEKVAAKQLKMISEQKQPDQEVQKIYNKFINGQSYFDK